MVDKKFTSTQYKVNEIDALNPLFTYPEHNLFRIKEATELDEFGEYAPDPNATTILVLPSGEQPDDLNDRQRDLWSWHKTSGWLPAWLAVCLCLSWRRARTSSLRGGWERGCPQGEGGRKGGRGGRDAVCWEEGGSRGHQSAARYPLGTEEAQRSGWQLQVLSDGPTRTRSPTDSSSFDAGSDFPCHTESRLGNMSPSPPSSAS